MMLLVYALCVLLSVCGVTVVAGPKDRAELVDPTVCVPNVNCQLPLCKCSDTSRPLKDTINLADTPQMIALTFSGVLTSDHVKYIERIFDPMKKKANGCAARGTFFVAHKGIAGQQTDYCFVHKLFDNNNEIGVSAVDYKCPYHNCPEEEGRQFFKWNEALAKEIIIDQKKNIASLARINRSFLRGFRLPFGDQGGSAHFAALKEAGFHYDASVRVDKTDTLRQGGLRFWPHTLDFAPKYACDTCPKRIDNEQCREQGNCTYPRSMWIIPNHFLNVEGDKPCPTLLMEYLAHDRYAFARCENRMNLNQSRILDQLKQNFEQHYKFNKAPFMINIELDWFFVDGERYAEMLTNALVQFIDYVTLVDDKVTNEPNDVFLVTLSMLVDYMEFPTPLQVIKKRWVSQCDDTHTDYGVDRECDAITKLREQILDKQKNETQPLELKGEDLFRNGVLGGVIAAFTLSILFIFIYDKFLS